MTEPASCPPEESRHGHMPWQRGALPRWHWFEPPGQRHQRPVRKATEGDPRHPATAWLGNDNFPDTVGRQAGPLSFSVFGALSPLPNVAVTGPVVALIRPVTQALHLNSTARSSHAAEK